MNPERFARLKEVVVTALRLPEERRSEYLDSVRENDRALSREAEELIGQRPADGMRTAGVDRLVETLFREGRGLGDPTPGVPDSVGPYRVLGVLGEGGMGVVYRAEQAEPIRREVALKVIRGSADSASVLARFDTERQSLAAMDHPNIATVLDAGSDAGQPYFVMELVRGVPITDYCRERRLDLSRRLRLFLDVCRAVRHAHRRGVIHRDLKPSNILVTEVGGECVPKVIDFSIAKALDDPSLSEDFRTRTGQLLGTLEYMSPEQARGETAIVDTRSDVYSLGVVLYELLAQRLPYDLKGLALHEAVHLITEEPPERLRDGTTGTRTSRDVEILVGKCLEKDPDRRYGSAAELVEDVERYLGSRPILARPPTPAYQLRTLIKRRKGLVAAVAVIAFAVAAGGFGTTIGFIRARGQAKQAILQAEIAREINDFFNKDLLRAAAPGAGGRDVTVIEILDAAADRIEAGFPDRPLIEAEIRVSIGSAYSALGAYEEAEVHLTRAHGLRMAALGPTHQRTLATRRLLGGTLTQQGRYDEAEAIFRELYDIQAGQLGEHDPATLKTLAGIADVLNRKGRPREAEPIALEVLGHQRVTLGQEHADTLSTLNILATIYVALEDLERAEELLEELVAIRQDLVGPEHPDTMRAEHNLIVAVRDHRGADAVLPLLVELLEKRRRILGDDHLETLSTAYELANAYQTIGRDEQALSLHREVLEDSRLHLGDDHPQTLNTMNSLAVYHARWGVFEEAEPLLRECYELRVARYGKDHPAATDTLNNLAVLHMSTGRNEEAEPMLREVLASQVRVFGEDGVNTNQAKSNLQALLSKLGRHDEAVALYREVVDSTQKTLGPEHPGTLKAKARLATTLRAGGELAEASELLEEVLAAQRQTLPTDDIQVGYTLWRLADLRRAEGRLTEADRLYQESMDIRRLHADGGEQNPTWIYVSACREALMGRTETALDRLQEAIDLGYTKAGKIGRDPRLASIRGANRFETILEDLKEQNRLAAATP